MTTHGPDAEVSPPGGARRDIEAKAARPRPSRRRILGLAGVFAAAMAGCTGHVQNGGAGGDDGSDDDGANDDDGENGSEPDPLGDVPPELVAGVREFGCDMLGELDEANLCLSPYSISVALAMTYAGARGETREAMADALQFQLDGEALHEGFAALEAELDERDESGDDDGIDVDGDDDASGDDDGDDHDGDVDGDDDAQPFALRVANAVWGQADYPFFDDYRETLDTYYGAGFREADFVADAEAERERINEWVAGETEDRIDELLPPGSLDSLARVVLTNAVYFEASWASTFPGEATHEATFTTADGEEQTVEMMRQDERFPHAVVDGHEVVELPYEGDEVGMLVVLPDGDLASLEADLDGELLAAFDDALEQREGTVSLPRFEFESGFGLADELTALGMGVAFDHGEADFGDMADLEETGEALFIWDVYHDTYIAVDEEGTEAAAATGVVVGDESAPADPFEFVADRPFLFVIRDEPTGTPLFLGRVGDVAAAQE